MADDDDGEPIEGLSFWEPGGYKKTTKRITDGNQLCTEIVDMVQERCEIEAAYASKLKSWSKRWIAQIDKGPEYGSMESAWKAVLTAADREADVHLRVKENLVSTIQNEMRRWQKENFHKGMMALHLKEKKEMDEEFRKAQKPWKKRFLAVEKSKKEYHDLCQKEQSVVQRSKMYQNDTGISEDQKAKTLDEIAKLNTQRQSARGNYEDALRDLNSYNARYMEDMKEVYARCQEMEHKRLDFFKDRLKAMHQNLDLSNDVVVKQIAADFLNTVEQANAKSDLKYWDAQRSH
ncbi:Protein kinase C and casein kinase II substrate protein 3 [Hypsibius exemplaris]|uniref:Protein kinase C and casein kinase II substrate protein 3 n=1 Tax=Hypsibius exemplaris TaxID=2072580 RepID=A0A1W0WVA8_HYPEX|nr:Protein kinase C and casein kinase II substrate protein 3 [Hypsibius exemplaris]